MIKHFGRPGTFMLTLPAGSLKPSTRGKGNHAAIQIVLQIRTHKVSDPIDQPIVPRKEALRSADSKEEISDQTAILIRMTKKRPPIPPGALQRLLIPSFFTDNTVEIAKTIAAERRAGTDR